MAERNGYIAEGVKKLLFNRGFGGFWEKFPPKLRNLFPKNKA
jgi:hypothetical protein